MKYTYTEIEQKVISELKKANLILNDYGILSIIEECEYFQNEENRPVEAQLDYIINEAIPSKCREEYFD